MVSPTFPFSFTGLFNFVYQFILKGEEKTQWVDKIYGCHTPKHEQAILRKNTSPKHVHIFVIVTPKQYSIVKFYSISIIYM